MIEKANKFWSNYIKNTQTDSAVSEDDYDVRIKEEVHQEMDPICEYECVSLMISPATMDDIMIDSKENIADNIHYPDPDSSMIQFQKQNSIYAFSCKHCEKGFNDM